MGRTHAARLWHYGMWFMCFRLWLGEMANNRPCLLELWWNLIHHSLMCTSTKQEHYGLNPLLALWPCCGFPSQGDVHWHGAGSSLPLLSVIAPTEVSAHMWLCLLQPKEPNVASEWGATRLGYSSGRSGAQYISPLCSQLLPRLLQAQFLSWFL